MENTSVEYKMENEKKTEFIKFWNGKMEILKRKISASIYGLLNILNFSKFYLL